MATNNLLTQPAPHYHKFVDNQVLTDDQLNSVLDYLNHQDRLSRMLLHGVGIVCGLKISINEDNSEIQLSDGVAVTTAGDLLKPDVQQYIGFKKFKDDNVKYPFFTDSEGVTIDLWELETDTTPSDVHTLSRFESTTDVSLKKTVALLYLEDYLGEEKDCSPVDCDTQGRPVINQVRVILVSPENAQKIAEQDSVFSNLLQGGNDPFIGDLSKMYIPRVLLNEANTQSFDYFKKAYEISFSTLANQISKLGGVSIFENIFDEVGIDPTSELHNLSITALNFQYIYDFYKDLTIAYNELRDLLKKNYALCCPDPQAFPKHILLGTLNKSQKMWRHPFYPSPTHVEIAVGKMTTAFRRLLNMIRDFKTAEKNEVRITPSRDDDFPLGRRAVPFYYNLEGSEDAATFLQNWKEPDIELVPNYYGMNYPGGGFDPLNVHLDDHDFYRIEGHTGKHITDAHKRIQEIQKNKSLPFDIQQVAIGGSPDESTIDYDNYRVYFEDFQVILQAWNEEQQCLMKTVSDFLTKFSTKDPGRHIEYLAAGQDTDTDSNNHSDFIEMDHVSAIVPTHYVFGTSTTSKAKKARENQVMKSISSEKDTLGFTMKDAIITTDNKNDIWVKTNNAVEELVRGWDPDIFEATIKIPGQLVGYLKETEDHKLTDIEDFTEENLEKYLESLKAQCQQTKTSKRKLQSLINKEASALRSKDWTENYLYVLNRITSSCCLIEKVKVLYEKIIERKKEVLARFVLDQFIRDHPGAEHKAGVKRGGTFILLYYSKNRERVNSAEISSRTLAMTMARESTGQPMPEDFSGRESGGMTTLPRTFNEEEAFRRLREEGIRDLSGIRGRTGIPLRENIPHGTVVGDLSLPYICCSGTPSTNFVFPEQLAMLRIPVDHVCVGEDGNTDPIPLSVTPAEGTVRAFIQKRELANVISDTENGTFFDPNNLSSEDYGNTIRFEVNGQPVEPTLDIYQKPTANFTVRRDIEFIQNNSGAVVSFKNTSTPFGQLTSEWDFDGQPVSNQNTVEFTHTFKVRPGENVDFQVKLTVFNGPCQDSITRSVNIDVPELDVPDNPDQPEDPEDPDQPERNCLDISTRAIKASFNIIEREVREDANEIDRRFLLFYTRQIKPMYELILGDPESALNGLTDDRVIPLIQEAQKMVMESVQNQPSDTGREFMLKIYYEMALLYFYVHSCRDSRIDSEIAMHDRQNNWLTFTEMATQEFGEALQMLLRVDKIQSKLDVIRERIGSRFDNQMNSIVGKIIDILRQFIG